MRRVWAIGVVAVLWACEGSQPAPAAGSGDAQADAPSLVDAADGASGDASASDVAVGDAAPGDAAIADMATGDGAGTDAVGTEVGPDTVADVPPGPDADATVDATDVADVAADAADVAPDGPTDAGPTCCKADSDCGIDQCVVEAQMCKPKPTSGSCWSDKDCAKGQTCQDAIVCPCGTMCKVADKPGTCSSAPPGCCGSDVDCAKGSVCIADKKVCKSQAELQPGQCWSGADCGGGEACTGAQVCPCGAACFAPDKPGKCEEIKPGCCGAAGGTCATGFTCVEGPDVCVKDFSAPAGQCWSNTDCPGGTCKGANICPCGAQCLVADKPGTCESGVSGCCGADTDCGPGQKCVPDKKVCKPTPPPGQCWNDGDCGGGQVCEDEFVCMCGALCGPMADKPGACAAPAACTQVDPASFGMCGAIVGWVFDGKSCVLASGCGCADKCAAVFKEEVACKQACGL